MTSTEGNESHAPSRGLLAGGHPLPSLRPHKNRDCISRSAVMDEHPRPVSPKPGGTRTRQPACPEPVDPTQVLRSCARKACSNSSNCFLEESWFFQLLKSGIKYSRISRAESLPVSASKHSQSRSASNETRRRGNNIVLSS